MRVIVVLVAVSSLTAALTVSGPNDIPPLTDQLNAQQAAAILSNANTMVCQGPEDCNFNGICDSNNLCRCAPGYVGIDCSVGINCPNNCSSNGVCRAHSCFCYHGYTGVDCAIQLFCPNNCNGNGLCDRGLCVCNAGFDGTDCSIPIGCAYKCVHGQCVSQQCVCEEGYYGSDCSDIDYCLTNCSNHGSCLGHRCICDFGYTGVVCSTMIPCPHNCSRHGECVDMTCMCDLGYTGLDCSEDCCPDQNVQCSAGKACNYLPCDCKNGCNDNGICHRGRCICREGFFADDCSLMYCPSNCSAHGSCDHTTGACTCDSGWKGNACADVECPNDCNGRGNCKLFGGVSRICLCEQGYTGAQCEEEVPCPSNCSGHGMCQLGTCTCQNGWKGLDCATSTPPWVPCELDCHGHGQCVDGLCVKCDPGWSGNVCSEPVANTTGQACPGTPPCNSNGICENGKCYCDTKNWLGIDCSIRKCPDDCNGRGSCQGGVCQCQLPYHSGALQSCELINCPANCSGPSHGNCNQQTGVCSCLPPWTTDDCSIQPCPGSPNECTNQGTCDHQTGLCDCLPDYIGSDCSIPNRCPNDCSGNGVCYRGVCYCTANFTGLNCRAVKRPPPPPGYDWQAPLRAAQALFATSRTSSPPIAPSPADYSDTQQKALFQSTYGDQWLRYWNLVHSTPVAWNSFVTAVTTPPPAIGAGPAAAAVTAQQKALFMQVFGDNYFNAAWSGIMANASVQQQFSAMFAQPTPTYTSSAARGDGLPPSPPLAREPYTGVGPQRLFTDVFGLGEGLAMEMMIFGNRTKRDLFTAAFSSFLKANMMRDIQDKRDSWQDDMNQLMTDALGAEGPSMLNAILSDPKRATLFRSAFAGYLEEPSQPGLLLVETGEGLTDEHSRPVRIIPPPV